MRILILGTGAMAKRFGAQLARLATEAPELLAPPTLAGSWTEAVRAIATRGIAVEDGALRWTAPARALPRQDLPEAAYDLVLVLVKSYQTAELAPVAAGALAPGGLVLSLQNGIGNRELLVAAAPGARVTAGVTSAGATGLGPRRVRFGGSGQTTLGQLPGEADAPARHRSSPRGRHPDPDRPRIAEVAGIFERAGLATDCSPRIDQLLWRKLAVNCAINPLTALEGLPNGALLEDPRLQARLRAAAREVEAVAAAAGLPLGLDAAALAEEVARRTAANQSSMLQDLRRGARTEIEAICGAVVREGRRLGVPTPVNAALWVAVAEAEAGRRPQPDRDAA